MSEKSIYDLKLHETTSFKQSANIITHVLRVPGGWLYRTVRLGHERTQMTEVFVPYDVDLIPKKDYINHQPGPEKNSWSVIWEEFKKSPNGEWHKEFYSWVSKLYHAPKKK